MTLESPREFVNSIKGYVYVSDNLGLFIVVGNLTNNHVEIKLLEHSGYLNVNRDLAVGHATTTVSAIRRHHEEQQSQNIMDIIKLLIVPK